MFEGNLQMEVVLGSGEGEIIITSEHEETSEEEFQDLFDSYFKELYKENPIKLCSHFQSLGTAFTCSSDYELNVEEQENDMYRYIYLSMDELSDWEQLFNEVKDFKINK